MPLQFAADDNEDRFLRPEDTPAPPSASPNALISLSSPHVTDVPPNTYIKAFDAMAYRLALLGASPEAFAEAFSTTPETISQWRSRYPSFDLSIRRGALQADAFVAQSLYRRATGYTHFETKIATHEGIITDERTYAKHIPPDVKAAIFWLKNRAQMQWREEAIPTTPPSPYAHNSLDQLKELVALAGLVPQTSPLESKLQCPDAPESKLQSDPTNLPREVVQARSLFPTIPVHTHSSDDVSTDTDDDTNEDDDAE